MQKDVDLNLDWIAFDADDTLWKNEETYLEGREIFLKILSKYDVAVENLDNLDQLEVKNIQYYGYGVMSFMFSLVEQAIQLTEENIHPGDILKLLDHAKKMLTDEVEVFPGVQDLLEDIGKEHRLMLITKGDLFHQQRKIKSSGLGKYFQAVEVVSEKNTEVYLEILERYQVLPDRFVMIGNSLRSDVLPVLSLGGWAIHLKGHLSWSHEDDPLDDHNRDRFIEVAGLSALPDVIRRLARGQSI